MIDKFVSTIEQFFKLCEGTTSRKDKLLNLYKCLAELHYYLLKITDFDSSFEGYEFTRLKDDEIRAIICKSFPNLGFYWCCLNINAMNSDPETGTGDAIDDLVDIYKELKEGYDLYSLGKKQDAIYHWISSYKFHWGEHLVELQSALHDRIYN